VVFSLNQYKFNPYPPRFARCRLFIPAPTSFDFTQDKLVGREEAQKQGITSDYSLGSPCFSGKSIYTYLPRAPLSGSDPITVWLLGCIRFIWIVFWETHLQTK